MFSVGYSDLYIWVGTFSSQILGVKVIATHDLDNEHFTRSIIFQRELNIPMIRECGGLQDTGVHLLKKLL